MVDVWSGAHMDRYRRAPTWVLKEQGGACKTDASRKHRRVAHSAQAILHKRMHTRLSVTRALEAHPSRFPCSRCRSHAHSKVFMLCWRERSARFNKSTNEYNTRSSIHNWAYPEAGARTRMRKVAQHFVCVSLVSLFECAPISTRLQRGTVLSQRTHKR